MARAKPKPKPMKVAAYRPHKNDPPALLNPCPVCPAQVGEWCGGYGDVHSEREP